MYFQRYNPLLVVGILAKLRGDDKSHPWSTKSREQTVVCVCVYLRLVFALVKGPYLQTDG